MRWAAVIIILAGIAVTLVQIRRAEIAVRHDIQQMQIDQVSLRRKLWDQQVQLGYLTAPEQIRRRAEAFTSGELRTDPLAQSPVPAQPTQ